MEEVLTKKCSVCGLEVPLSLFAKRKGTEDGLRANCKKCQGETSKRRGDKYEDLHKQGLLSLPSMKFCPRCSVEKSREEFPPSLRTKSGLQAYCKVCYYELSAARDKEHRAKTAALWRERNIDRVRIRENEHNRTHKEECYISRLKNCYGLTVDGYNKMLESQSRCCAMCQSSDPGSKKKHMCVDHDHSTGRVRGLLCNPCNRALGAFLDSEVILKSAIEYLTRYETSLPKETVGRCSFTPDQAKERHRYDRYGILPDEYLSLLSKQESLCAICHCPSDDGKSIQVDHNHKTGAIRGLLCGKCNRGIGSLSEKPQLLQQAIIYLSSHNGNT